MCTRSLPNRIKPALQRWQRGATIVEFALVALLFFTLLIGIMEFGRWLFTLNAANEATRLGARLAVVCSISDAPDIKARMHQIASGIPVGNMVIDYVPTACDASNCETVNVRLSGATFSPLIPLMGGNYPIPKFATSLPRELMNSTGNPVCP
ncbi:TadE family protein [Rhodoferax sp.]|uniref:TadE/TadG family type IV pilus assembly protein n=1 Tax=Rhodoferax sp. TaxID=50421 RepID=UPI0025EA3E1D|nr:TadE family protein [Rhodoferax sp.]MCM2342919.1 pilus assembly protein [Rhodoferax sp.]